MLNKNATIKIIDRLYSKPAVKIPDTLYECVCIVGEKAIFTDGYMMVITTPENLQVDADLFVNHTDIKNKKVRDSFISFSKFDVDSLDYCVLINRNKLTEKFKEAKNHKWFMTNPYNPYRFTENPILTQLGAGHMRYNTSLLIDAAKLFKGKNCYFAMMKNGSYAVVTDKERSAYAIIAPTFAHPFDEIDDIPSVKIEDIAEVQND